MIFSHRFGQLAGLLRRVEDLVVKDWEIQCEAQSDGMRWLHVRLADVVGILIGLLGVFNDSFEIWKITVNFYMVLSQILLLQKTIIIHNWLIKSYWSYDV